jgi:glycosyltransferase involved in cell wall biosynthesis
MPIALLYDDDAYIEQLGPPKSPVAGGPLGLMGRQVAGKAFLDAYLTHGNWDELVGLVRRRECADSLIRICQEHPSSRTRTRRLRIFEERKFHEEFFPDPPATVLYQPCPLDSKYAWARQHAGPDRLALAGVTHTLCSADAVTALCRLVTAPFEPYDALICTSRSVERMVRTVTGSYADYLRERHGGSPVVNARLETIPLGVDPNAYRPPTPAERTERRAALGIEPDEVVVLFVGRLAHHAKAHPFPLYRGAAEAARATGRKVRLIMAGWAANAAIREAFKEGAARFAPGIITMFVDGTAAANRFAVWHAADVFASLSDNIQETFGLVVIEAMASGLPVVATDWNGYRDLVVDGETGWLVPTLMVRDASADATSRLLLGEVNYDYFLAECSQAVAVDVGATALALTRLVDDAAQRSRMGAAGRSRVLARFAWKHVVRAYEALWESQETERRAYLARRAGGAQHSRRGPAYYPAPDETFGGYPTRMLAEEDQLVAVAGSEAAIEPLLRTPLTNHSVERRAGDLAAIRSLYLACRSPRSIGELDELIFHAGVAPHAGRATLAWMLKYGLLMVKT